MNTIIDLNNPGNVNYNSQSSYAISFGTNSGTANITVDETAVHSIPKQTPLNSITSPVRDLLIDVTFSGYAANAFPITGMNYQGPWSNISVAKLSTSRWRVSGIRSVAQYNEAFANVKLGPATYYNNTTYNYNTQVSDQFGNTRSWTTNVSLVDDPIVVVTGNVVYNEDVPANIRNITVNTVNSTQIYDLTISANASVGLIGNVTAYANAFTISGNTATINAAVTGNTVRYWPAHDRTTTGNASYALRRTGNATVVTSGNVVFQIGNTHSDFTMAPSIVMQEDTVANVAGFQITDIATIPPSGNAYTYTVSLSLGNTAGNLRNTVSNTYANSFSFSNSRANINSILAANTVQYVPDPDQQGNVTIRYTQTSIEDSLVQANVLLPVQIIDHADFSLVDNYVVIKNTTTPIQFQITDLDTTVGNYTVHIAEVTSSNYGEFFLNGNTLGLGNSSITLTGPKATVNAANVAWKSYPDQLPSASGLRYYQYKQDNLSGNVTQASNVPVTFTDGADYPLYNLPPTGTWTINTPSAAGAFIRDRDDQYTTYRVRYDQITPTGTGATDDTVSWLVYANGIQLYDRVSTTDWITGTRQQLTTAGPPGYVPWAIYTDSANTFIGTPTNTMSVVPPIDYGSVNDPGAVINFNYSQQKLVGNTWLPQASNVNVNLLRTGSNALYTLNTTDSYTEDTVVTLPGTIVDPGYSVNVSELGNITWTRTWSQVVPDPATYGPRWRVGAGAWSARGTANVSDSIIQVNPQLPLYYLPPSEYTGGITLTYTQTKVQEGDTFVQANAIPVNLSFAGGVDDYYFFPTAAGFVYANNTFGNVQIVEPDPAAEKSYNLTLTTASTTGNIYLGGVNYGNAANISGNAAQITSNVTTGYWAAGGTPGNVSLTWNIVRTTPDAITFVANSVQTLNITGPTTGAVWQGGIAVGDFDSTGANATPDTWLILAPDVFSPNFNFFSTSNLNLSVNSAFNGANNTANIVAAHGNAAIAASRADSLVEGGQSDWYLPSNQELTRVVQNLVTAGLNSAGSISKGNAYWHSSVANVSGQNRIGVVSYDSTLGPLSTDYTQAQGVTVNARQTAIRKIPK
jgi:hypothetical protein